MHFSFLPHAYFLFGACLTLLAAEVGAGMAELEALVATEVTFSEWLQQLRY